MVSIITPVYNRQEFLDECVQSILKQTFTDWELILVDDCSTDASVQMINNYVSSDNRIKAFFFNKNVGAGVARNKGIEISKGRFITFLDSDDYWHIDKLKMQIEFMFQKNIEFSYTYSVKLDKNDDATKILLPPKSVSSTALLFNNYIKTPTAMYDTLRIGKVFMPNYRKRQDWGLWFNILEKTEKAYCLPVPLAYFRTSNDSLSKNKLKLLKENFKFYRTHLKKNIILSFLLMILFLFVHLSFKFFFIRKLER